VKATPELARMDSFAGVQRLASIDNAALRTLALAKKSKDGSRECCLEQILLV